MFHDLRVHVSPIRRLLAVALLTMGLALGLGIGRLAGQLRPQLNLIMAAAALFLGVRLFTYLLLDPLLSNPRTRIPGFARDLVVLALYGAGSLVLLHRVAGLNLGTLLGTGAIAAAVVGLSLQETLGNLFAGISMHLEGAFRVGDWIEVTGTVRGGAGRETFIGQIQATTWRTLQLRTENGDTDIFPNRLIAQAVVTNLNVPTGPHRRTLRVIVEPQPDIHRALEALAQALAGLPHQPGLAPEVVAHSFDLGGVVLEVRWWALGWRHGRAGHYHAARLVAAVLPRLGFPLLGPHGATTVHPSTQALDTPAVAALLASMGLPSHWAAELKDHLVLRDTAPGEGIIREGDPGASLFMVVTGRLQVVRVCQREQPYTGLFWEVLADLGSGQWFGEASLLTGAPRNATVVTVSPCRLVEVPKAAFEGFLRRDPQVLETLVGLMEARSGQPAPSDGGHPNRAAWLAQMSRWFGLESALDS